LLILFTVSIHNTKIIVWGQSSDYALLTEEKTITVGWVVSFSDICRNIEFKSVRLWSVAE
ncbi:hypothetical protein AAH134_07245, partial [Bacteroides thetaiotaomicron]|uniref:hypothetical protein n=1 Tax=Bacteroides thetaiotaomicron TaxID=818 RepID=UPI0039B36877